MLAFAFVASAAAPALFGGATMYDGIVTLVSNTKDADTNNDYSGIAFDVAEGTTVADLSTLSTDYNVTDDDCAGGSPRFQLALDDDADGTSDGNVFVYLGEAPNFTGCAENTWESSGELIGSTEERFDLTQFGGEFYSTNEDLIAQLGDAEILEVTLVADGGWAFEDGEQTVLIDNVSVNGTDYEFTASPTTTNECKNGGWKSYTNPTFKNQGQCVSSVQNNSRNR